MIHASRQRPDVLRLAVGLLSLVLIAVASWFFFARGSAATSAGTIPPANAPSSAPAKNPATASAKPSKTPKAKPVTVLADESITPKRLKFGAVAIDTPIIPVGVTDDVLDLPPDPNVTGWWSSGAAPGSPVGTVLLAAHIDSRELGKGAMANLQNTPVGSTITIDGEPGQGSVQYRVEARRNYAKSSLPFESLFEQGSSPRLVVVTCGGSYDRSKGGYQENVVVVATPIG